MFERRMVGPAFGRLGHRIEFCTTGTNVPAVGRTRYEGCIEYLRQSLAPYSGHLRHGAAWGAWSRVWGEHPWLGLLFRRQGWAFSARWLMRVPSRARGFRNRYAQLVRGAGSDCLAFCRVGRYIEFYGPQRVLAERVLGLQRIYLPRAGYSFAVGFPAWLAARFAQKALERGCAVVIGQTGGTGVRERLAILWLTHFKYQ